MDALPDLSLLSESEKDELIYWLWAQLQSLSAKIDELEGRLSKNSRNSSQPPANDGLNKPLPKSRRQASGRPSGGQTEHPDRIVQHFPPQRCAVCRHPLAAETAAVVERRQVFDLPPLHHEVTEHQVLEIRCPCGKTYRGRFPEGVGAPVQYGPAALAAVVHLTHHHMLPMQRTAVLLGDFFALPMSQGTVQAAGEAAAAQLAPVVEKIGQSIQAAPIVNADETSLRMSGKRQWLHVLATPRLTWMACHAKRGKAAFDALALLPQFLGTLIHDGWKPYRDLDCTHGLCNAHHLRELTFVAERYRQPWAEHMIALRVDACHEVEGAGAPLPLERIAAYRARYAELLELVLQN